MRTVGTVVRGIRTPIIKDGDDLASIVVDSLIQAKDNGEFEFKDNVDVIYNFFSNKLLFEGFVPGAIIRFWRDVKKELQVLGFELTIEELDKINDEVLNREFEAVDRYMNLGEDAFIEFDKKCIELGLYLKTNEYVVRDDNVQLKKQ